MKAENGQGVKMDREYEKRINTYSLDELYDIRDHVDRERYPDRYSAVLARIEALKRNPTLGAKDYRPSEISAQEKRPPTIRDERLAIASFVLALVAPVFVALGFAFALPGSFIVSPVSSVFALILGNRVSKKIKARSKPRLLATTGMILASIEVSVFILIGIPAILLGLYLWSVCSRGASCFY